jgi:L-threonylcarbamoyladenylate synthase
VIAEAVGAVEQGLVVGLPTDTVYGIGADPVNPAAVERLFDLKGRPEHKPVGLLVASVEQASEIGEFGESARALAEQHWPGALTLVVVPRVILSDWVGHRQSRTVGIRVPDHPTALQLLEATGPLAVTSANESGGLEAMNEVEARAVFGDEVSVYVPGTSPGGEASTVVDTTGYELSVLREGPVEV